MLSGANQLLTALTSWKSCLRALSRHNAAWRSMSTLDAGELSYKIHAGRLQEKSCEPKENTSSHLLMECLCPRGGSSTHSSATIPEERARTLFIEDMLAFVFVSSRSGSTCLCRL